MKRKPALPIKTALTGADKVRIAATFLAFPDVPEQAMAMLLGVRDTGRISEAKHLILSIEGVDLMKPGYKGRKEVEDDTTGNSTPSVG